MTPKSFHPLVVIPAEAGIHLAISGWAQVGVLRQGLSEDLMMSLSNHEVGKPKPVCHDLAFDRLR